MMQGRVSRRGRSALGTDLTILALVGVMLFAALGAAGVSLYQQVYSASAFVQRYLDLLASGRAADALRVPGVSLDLALQKDTGIHSTASEALLRSAALAQLTDYDVVSEQQKDGVYSVTTEYRAGGVRGTSTFHIVQNGWIGVVPNWEFESSPLAEIELTVRGADVFAVNGFQLDRRQVSSHGMDAKPLDPLHLLVFTPGAYSVTVDTSIASTPGVRVLADQPLARTPVDVQAQPTEKFTELVQQKVEEFLSGCAEQQVLLPTACPFGLEVSNRIADGTLPKWSISQQPVVKVLPDGANWKIPPTDAVAHIVVKIMSVFDGSVRKVSEDVPFQIDGTISILADGTASIRVGSPDIDPD
ncbi:hypothetical protein Q9R19_09810 [Microbacterium sp. ARD32]|uniref:hypothetical protein n=1 Tax=Microbacterium sp. ARD32 TaxID=2962577 RepID=UPI0028811977|nr:hypothetical protein [Microbacterium sp. ARD32]MDT0157918.1 hypothetical protein [Microbacterium sp. ARD32]